MASAPQEQHAIFLGNLDDSVPKPDVAAMISRLILQASGLPVELAAIRLKHSRPSRCFTACINFSSQVDQQRALEALKIFPVIPNGLVKDGRHLRVDIYKPKFYPAQLDQFTNPYGDYYFKGQQLGNETRILEFKRGGGDLRKQLKKHLAKYTCAFLNGQGGTLMIGVDDTGTVQGVHCDRKQEDHIRINIDNIIHQFDPPVLPQMYQVQFTPVTDQSGQESDLKVIEIQVNHSGRSDTLYETSHGEVYMRRDGSVRGPLRAKDIQEWCRLKFSNNVVEPADTVLQDQVDNLQERLQKLETHKQELDSTNDVKRTNSTVCTIL